MSCSLYWRPATARRTRIGDGQLRDIIRDWLGAYPLTLTEDEHAMFFKGLSAAGISGAQDVANALGKHGSIVIEIEC